MIVADAGQRPESWRVDRTALGRSARLTVSNPTVRKNGAAVVVAR
jgi:hypothetical protein